MNTHIWNVGTYQVLNCSTLTRRPKLLPSMFLCDLRRLCCCNILLICIISYSYLTSDDTFITRFLNNVHEITTCTADHIRLSGWLSSSPFLRMIQFEGR